MSDDAAKERLFAALAEFDIEPGLLGKIRRAVESRCYFCKCAMLCPSECAPTCPEKRTIDHLTPKCRGGGNGQENKVVCCYACNQAKGDMTEEEFWFFLRQREFADSYLDYLGEREFKKSFAFLKHRQKKIFEEENGDDSA